MIRTLWGGGRKNNWVTYYVMWHLLPLLGPVRFFTMPRYSSRDVQEEGRSPRRRDLAYAGSNLLERR